ncbi:hypothetical protein O181_065780 [Austropuccinia psidii MF-1]|uniref:Chromo domain-containing protein n=1 Tax=Austropuccinia psidii MF-1 TaxID=1389203 RepID=A0A9Q3EMT9_9BASI|nr:hypothetical protein [Austropuccinia psidii MF-1]
MERIKTCAWWPSWRKDVSEYFHSCDRFPKGNKATGKRFGLMIHIKDPFTPLKVVHMDWETALPPGGDNRYNECLVIVDRYGKTPIFLPCHKDETAMDTALLIWNTVISHTEYHPQTFKDSDGFTHDWCTLKPALELAYKTSIQASKGKPPAVLEKGWNPKHPVDTLKKDLVDIHPTYSSFQSFLDKVRHNENQSMNDAFEYAKEKWYKSHKTPEFKVRELILVSTLSFNNIKGPKKLKDYFSGPFIIKALHGTNAVQVELSGELENKHPNFPVSLVKHYTSSDKELFSLRNETPLEVPPLDQSEEKKVLKVLKERRLRGKNEREYLVRYRNPQHEDEWIVAEKIPDSQRFCRRFRHERRPIPQ